MNALTRAKSACLLAVVFLLSISTTQARTIYVASDGTGDFKSIKAAVEAATSGDVIIVGVGTYTGRDAVDIAVNGRTLTIRGSDPNDPAVVAKTIIDCRVSGEFGLHFIEMGPGKDTNLTLAGLTITHSTKSQSGGAVLCHGGILRAVNCTFADNAVECWGGAVYCENSQATFEGCTFLRNGSAVLRGGAAASTNSQMVFSNCLFQQNTGNAMTGFDSLVSFSDCTFEDNTGSEGGAIYNYVALGTETAVPLTVTRCTFAGNSANSPGGAIHSYAASSAISACLFVGNKSLQDGGAVYNHRCSSSIESSLFLDNEAAGAGGAVTDFYQCNSAIVHCTFVGNKAAQGGAVTSKRQSHPSISHCILWDNEADKGSGLYVVEDLVSGPGYSQATVEYSDIEFGRSGIFVEQGCLLNWSAGNIAVDPQFLDPSYGDYHLSANSPCVDAGDPALTLPSGARDLDSLPRLSGLAPDLGAYEFQGLGPVYGFRSLTSGKQFYTMSVAERDRLIQLSSLWRFEGIVFYAFYNATDPQVVPAYRFWADRLGSHLWTTSEKEKNKLLTNPAFSSVWTYEGISFYVYPSGKQPMGTVPLYRFWSPQLGYHYYTLQESERDRLIREYPDVWIYERVAWYVYPTVQQIKTATFDFAGAADQARYTVTLRAYVDGKEATIDLPELDLRASTAHMRMNADFAQLTATLLEFDIRSDRVSHNAVIKVGSLQIPFSVAAQGTFTSTTSRGPFTIDAATNTFADFFESPQILESRGDSFTFDGMVQFGERALTFSHTANAIDFELSAQGTFESLDLLPGAIHARMPRTFQWRRPDQKELLVETFVDGRRVELHIASMYAATQGLWVGTAVP
jgi:hypothetical protein